MEQFTHNLKTIIDSGIKIFDETNKYPIFDETYRTVLESQIINHYYYREIGVQNVGQFIFYLNSKMKLIMPFYNKKYSAMNLEQRILDNYDVTETYTRDITGTGTTTQGENSTTKNLNKFSDSPQSRVDLTSAEYITNLTDDTVTVDNDITGTNNSTNHESWTRTMKGNIGIQTDADAVNKYIGSLLNIDMEIISELNELFMGVY